MTEQRKFDRTCYIAENCAYYTLDNDEDELYTDESTITCYNCRYRRWLQEGFECMKNQLKDIGE